MVHKQSSAEHSAHSAVLIPHRPSPMTSYPDNATIHTDVAHKTWNHTPIVPGLLLSTKEVEPEVLPNNDGGVGKGTHNRVSMYANDLTAYK